MVGNRAKRQPHQPRDRQARLAHRGRDRGRAGCTAAWSGAVSCRRRVRRPGPAGHGGGQQGDARPRAARQHHMGRGAARHLTGGARRGGRRRDRPGDCRLTRSSGRGMGRPRGQRRDRGAQSQPRRHASRHRRRFDGSRRSLRTRGRGAPRARGQRLLQGRLTLKITAIRMQRLKLPLDPPFLAAWDPTPRTSFDATVVRVETDDGVTRIGSGDTMDGFEAFAGLFIGEDPLRIARHVRVLETISFHAGRYWPLEAALWDIAGKVTGQPVSVLFGASSNMMPAYASCGEIKPPAERADSALELKAQGFRALKIRFVRERLPDGIETVRAVRKAVGSSMEIMVDMNQAWRMAGDVAPALDTASVRKTVEELTELGVLWIEEPLPGGDVRGLAQLRAATGARIAGGEMTRTVPELLAYLDADSLDVYQPDVVLAVGMSRAKLVGELALLKNKWVTPPTWTNGLGGLANLHVVAGVGGGPFLEFPYDPPGWTPERRDFFLAEPLRIRRDGCLAVPPRPGLGVPLDESALSRLAASSAYWRV